MVSQAKDEELKMLDSQARMISQQLEGVDSSILEIEYLKNSLDELKLVKKDSEILAPMSNGIFVKASIHNVDKLLVNVGNNVVVEKSIEETKVLLDEQAKEMMTMRETLIGQMQKLEDRLMELEE